MTVLKIGAAALTLLALASCASYGDSGYSGCANGAYYGNRGYYGGPGYYGSPGYGYAYGCEGSSYWPQ